MPWALSGPVLHCPPGNPEQNRHFGSVTLITMDIFFQVKVLKSLLYSVFSEWTSVCFVPAPLLIFFHIPLLDSKALAIQMRGM